jgi:cytochrome c oxidase assembly protein subunit 15
VGWAVTIASAAVVVVGVVVTGSGPHSGDEKAVRTGLDPEMISQLHVDVVFLLLGLTVATFLAAHALRHGV